MGKRSSTGLFIFLIAIASVILVLDRSGALLAIRGMLEGILLPVAQQTQRVIPRSFFSKDDIAKLQEERNDLQEKVARLRELEKENEDLRLQLGIAKEDTGRQKLIFASVLSTSRFFIVDRGEEHGVRVDNIVTFKNILVGKVISVSRSTSRILLPIEKESVVEAKVVQTGAKGLVKGQGDAMLLSEVLLSEELSEGDTVQTVGRVDEAGLGIRPGLLLGKIEKVRKSENELFQEAKLSSLLDFETLQNVFIVL